MTHSVDTTQAQRRPVYLNGQFVALEDAHISVLDRGFLFGDGVYEVIPVYAGRPFRLEEHLTRLDNSLRAIRMEPPLSHAQWRDILEQLLALQAEQDLSIYLQVTRGADDKRDHAIPRGVAPTLFVMCSPMPAQPPASIQQGVAAITADDQRWHMCQIKAVTLLANVLLKQKAADEDAMETILIRDGLANEGAASNLFIVADATIVTPPTGCHLLPGITRDLVLELARESGMAYKERSIEQQELSDAEEIWLTSSTREIMPVITLNGAPVGNGAPGPLWRRMSALYQERKAQLRRGEF
jgi:D-alanine transaminase